MPFIEYRFKEADEEESLLSTYKAFLRKEFDFEEYKRRSEEIIEKNS